MRRGSDELWLVWCIGNTGYYGTGPLEQYVHMIEMSANGALFGEFDHIREINERRLQGEAVFGNDRPIRVHVVKPEYPLPLDPEFFVGGIDATTLIAMGYRDARGYLDQMSSDGVALDPTATRMNEAPLGFRFRERAAGEVSFTSGERIHVRLDVVVEVIDAEDFQAHPEPDASVIGSIHFQNRAEPIFVIGRFHLTDTLSAARQVLYDLSYRLEGRSYRLQARKQLHDDPGFDLYQDVTTLEASFHEVDGGHTERVGAGTLRLDANDLRRLATSFRPTGARRLAHRVELADSLGRKILGDLWRRYA